MTNCQKNCFDVLENADKQEVKNLWSPYSQLFCDFGDEFEVLDQNGEMPVSAMVQSVTKVIKPFICVM